MYDGIKSFDHPKFGKIRVIVINGELYFVGKDVALMLGYKNTRKAIIDHCKYAKTWMEIKGLEARPLNDFNTLHSHTVFIPESDVYRLIFSSKLPGSEVFQDWVFGEVLPFIRKNMSYDLALSLNVPILLKQLSEAKQNTSGYIYIARVVDTDFYKIGMTCRYPNERFQDLVNISHSHIFPVELELIASIFVENRFKSESLIHNLYEQKRLHGEWFEFTEDEMCRLIHKCFSNDNCVVNQFEKTIH